MLLDENVQDDINKLQREFAAYRITELQREEAGIRSKLRNISRSGIYSNPSQPVNGSPSIASRSIIHPLPVRGVSGADVRA